MLLASRVGVAQDAPYTCEKILTVIQIRTPEEIILFSGEVIRQLYQASGQD